MIAPAFAALAALLHAATAWRYGYFRDELYFIACSKHLAWGYVDQPPMVALAAWLSSGAGYELIALRALPILAAALTVYLAIRIARELGAGGFGQILAGTATMLLPAYLLLGNTLTTTSFEPLFWTLLFYLAIRIVRASLVGPSLWLALGAAIALGAYAKYSIALPVLGIAAGLLVTPQRRTLRSRFALYALMLAVVLLAPNIAWQTAHAWPILQVLGGDVMHRPAFQNGLALETYGIASNAVRFALEQVIYANPLALPIWVAGAIAPFIMPNLRDLRFITVAYVAIFILAVAFDAKGYYIVGCYATLLALGGVYFERAALPLRRTVFGALLVTAVIAMPLSLPVLPVDGLIAYERALRMTGRAGTPAHLVQPVFAEEFGWRRLAHDVASVYDSLPATVRNRTAIYADTYADAGALDFFGGDYGLPPAISSQNNYYLWGTRGYDGSTLIAIGATRIDLLRRYYRRVELVRTSAEPYKWIVEGPSPIYFCRGPLAPLSVIWPRLRWYGA